MFVLERWVVLQVKEQYEQVTMHVIADMLER